MADRTDSSPREQGLMEESGFQYLRRITRLIGVQFIADRCTREANALAYRALLSLVPIMSLTVGILATASDDFGNVSGQVVSTAVRFFLPDADTETIAQMSSFVGQRDEGITLTTLVAFIVFMTFLLNSLETTFNRIWGARSRSPLVKFIIFSGIVVWVPVLLGFSIYLTGKLQQYTSGVLELGNATWIILYISPIVLTWAALTLAYVALPNTRVLFGPAATGAVFAAVLWEVVKVGFALYLKHVASYETFYDTLWILPVFVVAMYLLWVVVLLGAEIGFTIQNYRHHATGGPMDWARSSLHLGMAVVLDIARQFTRGERVPTADILSRQFAVGIPYLRSVLDDLVLGGVIMRAGDRGEGFTLTRAPDKMTLGDVYTALEQGSSLGFGGGEGRIIRSYRFEDIDDEDTTIRENAIADSFWERGWEVVDLYYNRGRDALLDVLSAKTLADLIADLEGPNEIGVVTATEFTMS